LGIALKRQNSPLSYEPNAKTKFKMAKDIKFDIEARDGLNVALMH
jgi:hypothetical protein